ncbi:MAG: hypothetical protein LDL11_03160 [Desulfarculus sp.]|nr:hypothetical protein [Desulfarculus sp.]
MDHRFARRRLGRLMLAAVMAWLLTGCAVLPPPAMVGVLPGADQVRDRLEARRQAVKSFSLLGEIVAKGPGGEVAGEHRILGQYPDRLRAEIDGPFGKPALLLICDGTRLAVLNYGEGKGYLGPASRANLSRFLGLLLTPAEIYTLLSGSIPLLPAEGGQVFASSVPGQAVLNLSDDAGFKQGVIFSPGDYSVFQSWINDRDGGEISANFSDFVSLPAGRFPRRMLLMAGEGRELTLANDRLTINPPGLDPARFEPVLPPGVEVQELP